MLAAEDRTTRRWNVPARIPRYRVRLLSELFVRRGEYFRIGQEASLELGHFITNSLTFIHCMQFAPFKKTIRNI